VDSRLRDKEKAPRGTGVYSTSSSLTETMTVITAIYSCE